MHPDSPIRQLDEIIRRYGVTCLKLVPFAGGGYAVELGSHVISINVGGGSLAEAIGKAFLDLMKATGAPFFDELLEQSSLGTPEVKRIRASANPKAVAEILKKAHTYENPAVHWDRHKVSRPVGALSVPSIACGLVRGGGTHARFAKTLDEVTCGRCKNTSWYRSELWKKNQQQS